MRIHSRSHSRLYAMPRELFLIEAFIHFAAKDIAGPGILKKCKRNANARQGAYSMAASAKARQEAFEKETRAAEVATDRAPNTQQGA
ncbi:hypothetical protein JTE90_000769 [Oedothorax gibbosus]|uniref:Uncharacterized protein n=1 Tax=Oedothorax gibbosus TaxID=931172 RepID=A0AAV6THS5_9ARAC|nr:hypothetical protein JTE90_000769 [Oedothorax gibbosus]